MEAELLRREIEYALSERRFANRIFTVIVGPTVEAGNDVPWILLRQPHIQVESLESQLTEIIKDIETLALESADVPG